MKDTYISNPRPIWDKDSTLETRGKRIMTIGSTTGGVVVRVSRKGVEFNGYYAGFREGTKYGNMRDFSFMSWDDFDRMREAAFRRKPVQKKVVMRDPDAIDEKPNKKYYDPRAWQRVGEVSFVERLKEAFADLNCIEKN